MAKKYDVCALGELLIDFTESGLSKQGNRMLEANPGGAPCNVLAMLAKLGHKTAFIGKVGKDMFGDLLETVVSDAGIDVSGLVKDEKYKTTLAFVHTFEDGDRDFSFYRDPGADMMLGVNDLNENILRDCTLFHFGTLSMTHEGCREATKKAIDIAKENGALVSFDPNLREPLWKTLNEARKAFNYGMSKCDILKISDNEISWFTGIEDYDEAAAKLMETYPNIKLLLVSLGKVGSRAYCGDKKVTVAPFLNENTIETTGAGDTFCASVLHYVLTNGLKAYSEAELTDMLRFANAAASIITTKKGALKVMPEPEEVYELLRSR